MCIGNAHMAPNANHRTTRHGYIVNDLSAMMMFCVHVLQRAGFGGTGRASKYLQDG